jgi:BolA protein
MIIEKIKKKLLHSINPEVLNVVDESSLHSLQSQTPTHCRIEIVSEKFENLTLLKRHRLVQEIIKEELKELKASSLQVLTREEWLKRNKEFYRSPSCHKSKK